MHRRGDDRKVLVGGVALMLLGSSMHPRNVEYLVKIGPKAIDEFQFFTYYNANANAFFNELWEMEKRKKIASPQTLLELRAFNYVNLPVDCDWHIKHNLEFDISFLAGPYNRFNLSGLKILPKYMDKQKLSGFNRFLERKQDNANRRERLFDTGSMVVSK